MPTRSSWIIVITSLNDPDRGRAGGPFLFLIMIINSPGQEGNYSKRRNSSYSSYFFNVINKGRTQYGLEGSAQGSQGKAPGYLPSLPGLRRVGLCRGAAGDGGKGTGAAFINNVSALAQVRLNLSTIHSAAEPDLTYDFFGQRLAFPLLGAPMCGTARNLGGIVTDREFIRAQVDGAVAAGTLAMVGDGADPTLYPEGLEALRVHGGLGVPIIKPREPEEIIKRMQWAEEAGALAVGIDIDGAAFRYMNRMGEPVGPKTLAQLREIIGSTRLPVILKGIMTVKDAVAAVAAGAAGIVVSNHGGRALDHTPGTIEVLPEIVAAVKGRIRVFMDGGSAPVSMSSRPWPWEQKRRWSGAPLSLRRWVAGPKG